MKGLSSLSMMPLIDSKTCENSMFQTFVPHSKRYLMIMIFRPASIIPSQIRLSSMMTSTI
ncbi:hypothetical protein D8S78_24510 [Natrialba swarupiae]|nr:hypothetical protein [Natrialba swarupiae]